MAANWAVTTAFRALDQVSSVFNRMSKAGDKFGDNASNAFRRASKSGSRFGDIVKGFLVADVLQRGIYALKDFAVSSFKLASDLGEVQNVVNTTFGKMSGDIDAWSKTALKQFGLTELQAKQFSSTIGALIKPAGISGQKMVEISQNLSGLAGDFASFFNLPIEDAFNKIRSGISGETEPLKALGINMSVANMEAFALTQGIEKQWKNMSQAEQTLLRYNFIMKASKDAQGDFSKTLGESFANQKRLFDNMKAQAGAKVFAKLVSPGIELFKGLNAVLESINWDAVGETIKSTFDILISGIKWIIKYKDFMIPLVTAFLAYAAAAKTVAIYQGIVTSAQLLMNAAMSANPIFLIIAAVAALVAGLILLEKRFQIFSKSWGAIKEFFGFAGSEKVDINMTKSFESINKVNPSGKMSESINKVNPPKEKQPMVSAGQIIPPNQNQAAAQAGSYSGELVIRDETKRGEYKEQKRGSQPVRYKYLGPQPGMG